MSTTGNWRNDRHLVTRRNGGVETHPHLVHGDERHFGQPRSARHDTQGLHDIVHAARQRDLDVESA